MPKLNILSLKRPKAEEATRTFKGEVEGKSAEITLTIKTRRESSEMASVESARDFLVATYCQENSFPVQWDGEDLQVNPGLCFAIATIMNFEQGEVSERYTFHEWLAISAGMRDTFAEIFKWVCDFCTVQKNKKANPADVPND